MIGITQDLLKELFSYRDGNLYWKVAKGSRAKIGDCAGYVDNRGYRTIQINGKNYLAHRLIFLYRHGLLPQFLDHIDGNPSNNDINNLREATKSQNSGNSKKRESMNGKRTLSIYKGVTWDKCAKKWLAQIMIDGKTKYCGYYDIELEAAKSYDKAAIAAFGEFAKVNGCRKVRMDQGC